jgi:hypothetical protein
LNEDRNLSYNRADSADHISAEDFERFKSFKSGVILDAVLLILELSKSEKFYDYLKFYEEKVAEMVSIARTLLTVSVTFISDLFLAIYNTQARTRL